MQDSQSSDNDSDFGRCESPPLPDACHRCGSRVYPVERVDVGALFHRRCFRCRVCGLQVSTNAIATAFGSYQSLLKSEMYQGISTIKLGLISIWIKLF